MSLVSIDVEIDGGKITALEPQMLPERGRGVLVVLMPEHTEHGTPSFSVENDPDGLPVIRATGKVITSALVREVEGFAA